MKYKVKPLSVIKHYELEDKDGNLYYVISYLDEKMNPEDYEIDSYAEEKISKRKEKELIEAIIQYEKKVMK